MEMTIEEKLNLLPSITQGENEKADNTYKQMLTQGIKEFLQATQNEQKTDKTEVLDNALIDEQKDAYNKITNSSSTEELPLEEVLINNIISAPLSYHRLFLFILLNDTRCGSQILIDEKILGKDKKSYFYQKNTEDSAIKIVRYDDKSTSTHTKREKKRKYNTNTTSSLPVIINVTKNDNMLHVSSNTPTHRQKSSWSHLDNIDKLLYFPLVLGKESECFIYDGIGIEELLKVCQNILNKGNHDNFHPFFATYKVLNLSMLVSFFYFFPYNNTNHSSEILQESLITHLIQETLSVSSVKWGDYEVYEGSISHIETDKNYQDIRQYNQASTARVLTSLINSLYPKLDEEFKQALFYLIGSKNQYNFNPLLQGDITKVYPNSTVWETPTTLSLEQLNINVHKYENINGEHHYPKIYDDHELDVILPSLSKELFTLSTIEAISHIDAFILALIALNDLSHDDVTEYFKYINEILDINDKKVVTNDGTWAVQANGNISFTPSQGFTGMTSINYTTQKISQNGEMNVLLDGAGVSHNEMNSKTKKNILNVMPDFLYSSMLKRKNSYNTESEPPLSWFLEQEILELIEANFDDDDDEDFEDKSSAKLEVTVAS